jgi:hypothetical protein
LTAIRISCLGGVRVSVVGAGLDGLHDRDHVLPAVAEANGFTVELTGEVEQR